MHRPVKRANNGKFGSLTPAIDDEVFNRMERQAERLSVIAQREALIAKLTAHNAQDQRANALDRAACEELEARKQAHHQAVMKGTVIHVDFAAPQQQKPPKRAA